jgi:hypothetical protein
VQVSGSSSTLVVEAFAVYLETRAAGSTHQFVATPQTVTIPNDVTIGIAGDWGTGDWRTVSNPAPSTDVRKKMAFLNPDVTIHLGDHFKSGQPLSVQNRPTEVAVQD